MIDINPKTKSLATITFFLTKIQSRVNILKNINSEYSTYQLDRVADELRSLNKKLTKGKL